MTTKKEYKSWITDFGFDKSEFDEIYATMQTETDFNVGDYRFIRDSDIEQIFRDEILSDEHVIGCCAPWFIASILEVPISAIEKIQKADCIEALGILIKAQKPDEYVEKLANTDGYGSHFATYDGEEHNFGDWYAFRCN